MPIEERDISILIPTFRYREKVIRALESALASGAGEIIVTDDHSGDGTIEALAAYRDPRLTVHENPVNLGLWENHLHALSMATKPWIKFIQADDYLLPGGLAQFAAAAEPDVSVISGAPICKDDETGNSWLIYKLQSPLTWDWPAFEQLTLLFHWVLGTPSFMLLRADAITRDPAAWRSDISADLVVGAVAASRGLVRFLPPGAVGHGAHKLQDTHTQKPGRGIARSMNSLAYLRNCGDERLRRYANAWAALGAPMLLRALLATLVRHPTGWPNATGHVLQALRDTTRQDWRELRANRVELSRANRFRRTQQPPFDLDLILATQ
jgi:hypothetical protein